MGSCLFQAVQVISPKAATYLPDPSKGRSNSVSEAVLALAIEGIYALRFDVEPDPYDALKHALDFYQGYECIWIGITPRDTLHAVYGRISKLLPLEQFKSIVSILIIIPSKDATL